MGIPSARSFEVPNEPGPEAPASSKARALLTRTRAGLLAAASGLVFAASSPQANFDAGILVGLIGFAYALEIDAQSHETAMQRMRAGARRGFWFGFAANMFALRFVPDVLARFTPLPWIANSTALVLLSAAQALPWVAGGSLARILVNVSDRDMSEGKPPLAPSWLAFGICVYSACFIPSIFPWTPAGGLARWPILLQTAELVGERGTSFVLAIACGFAATAIRWGLPQTPIRRRVTKTGDARVPLAFSLAVLLVVIGYGAVRMRSIEELRRAAPHAKVALLQPDFDAMFRWEEHRASMMMDRLSALTKRAESEDVELTIWPESAYPYTLAHGVKYSPRGQRAVLQQGAHGPVLTGAYLTKGGGVGTNSTILVTRTGDIGPSQDKRHLLWFGETVPLGDVFPVLRRVFARGTGLDAGTESIAFHTGAIRAAVLNCYEDTLPAAGREAMEARPNLLVNVTNDAWFAGSAEGELHLRLSVMRAIETRRDLVRAVNRGPTTWVDAAGTVRMRRESTAGLGPSPPLIADAALLDAPITLYTRAGDLPLIALVLAALVNAQRRRATKAQRAPPPKEQRPAGSS